MNQNEVTLESKIKEIVDQRGAALLKTPSIFCAILDDLVPHLPQERKIFRRALTDKASNLLFLAINAEKQERDIILAKLELYFTDDLGLSKEWSNHVISIFSAAFNWDYMVQVFPITESSDEPARPAYNAHKLSKVISAGAFHTLAIRENGTVIATGDNRAGQCNVSGWKDIIAVAGDAFHSVGLRANGTVVATTILEPNKKFDVGQCNVSTWSDIVDIAVGNAHTVGLKVDGTVVATGSNRVGQCNVSSWKDIIKKQQRLAMMVWFSGLLVIAMPMV